MTQAFASGRPRDDVADPPRLDLILYPNPPLGRHGMVVVMTCALLIGAVLGAAFMAVGAWPVTGFLGLDVLALGWALHHASRRSRQVEILRLDRAGLWLRRLGPGGEEQGRLRFEPAWVQVVVDERRRHDPKVFLRSHGRSTSIGGFLPGAERREIAQELRRALERYQSNGS